MKKLYMIIACMCVLKSFAQTITSYTETDGLLSNFVECIAIDINDNIWFGTSIGLQKYDEVNWTTYNTSTYPDMASDNIKVITCMTNGDVWIGTDNGVSKFDGTNWTTYNASNGLNNNQVKSIDEDPNGNIWVGTMTGASYFDGNNWSTYGSPDLHWSGVNATAFDSNGDIWFGSPLGGITHFDGTNFVVYDTANGLLSQNVTDLAIDINNNKWIGTGGGMSVLNATNTSITNHTKMYVLPPPDTLNPVVNIDFDSSGNPWVSIYVGYLAVGGVAYFDVSGLWIDFDISDGLIGPNVRELAIASDDIVWIATSTGVSKIDLGLQSSTILDLNTPNIYPNPVQEYLNIYSVDLLEEILIYNSYGSLVYMKNIIDYKKTYNINISYLSKGVYYLRLKNAQNFVTKKIIIP